MEAMTFRPTGENPQPAPVPRLVVELPSRAGVFFANLRDTFFPQSLPPLELQSAPAPFWPDVFVKRDLPWSRFFQSSALHVVAFGLLIGFAHILAMQPQAVPQPFSDHPQVIVYQPTEYLPPLDTRELQAPKPRKADPGISKQPIISVPREPDNGAQTIVTPPAVRLKRDVALPNIVAWSDTPQKPQLEIPAVPLTPAAEITRLAPRIESVVAPPPDATQMTRRYTTPALQTSVVAPPTDVQRTSRTAVAPQATPIAPPPSMESNARRSIGELNIAPSAVIAPAPQLAVGAQRTVAGGGRPSLSPQVLAPPPSLSGGGSSGTPAGSRGRVIALSLHPALNAPADPPAGNRRGTFAATPAGHAGASGDPGATAGKGSDSTSSSGRKGARDVPSGLYVGDAGAKTSPVAGNSDSANARQPGPAVVATVHAPRAADIPATSSPAAKNKLSEEERAIFQDRKFYSLTLNMPNLNSAGGSWVIRFAEMSPSLTNGKDAVDLSQPAATRKVDPAYPIQLMRENVAGTVILYAVIRADGSVGSVRVLRGVDERLDRYAREAVAQWQFHPARRNGTPVDVEATFQIPFKPSRVGSNF